METGMRALHQYTGAENVPCLMVCRGWFFETAVSVSCRAMYRKALPTAIMGNADRLAAGWRDV